MPLYKLLHEMPFEELQIWLAYFEKRPIGWRDDDRAYKYLQTQGVKEKPWVVFPSLKAIYSKSDINEDGTLNVDSLKNSAIFSKMLAAKGGDKLEL